MNIIGYELKKIWQPGTLFIVALLSSLFYFLFLSFDIEYFPNGHPATEDVALSKELLQRYGSTPDEGQVREFVQEHWTEYKAEAEGWITTNPIFAEVGINHYADYMIAKNQPEQDEALSDAIWILNGPEANYIGFKLQSLEHLETKHNEYLTSSWPYMKKHANTDYERKRLDQMKDTGEYRYVMSSWVYNNTAQVMYNFALLVILATLVLVSPLVVHDQSSHVRLLQYSSRLGRRLIRYQLTAVMLSSFLLTTLLLIVMSLIYRTNETWMFWNTGLASFLNSSIIYLFSMTYGNYIFAYIAILYAISIGTATAAFMLSRFSQNIIALILKLVVAFGLIGLLNYSLNTFLFTNLNPWYKRTHIVGIEPIIALVFLGIGYLLARWIIRREHKVEWA